MSSVSYMRAKVAEQERLNSQLRHELNVLSSGVASANNSWQNLTNYINGTLVNGVNRVASSHERTVRAYEVQCEIEQMYQLFKNVEFANKKIRACNNKIYYDFANYRSVRKIVQALLTNIEHNFVSDRVLTKAVEVEHLQLPDYWLTCALLSIMAWKNDNKPLAQKALERACKLDKKNTSLFFFAFHVRLEKDPVALQWFANYITCMRTGEDHKTIMLMFALINKTTTVECGDELISKVQEFVNKLIAEDMQKSGYSQDQMVERIQGYLRSFVPNERIDYPTLAKYCKEMPFLHEEMMLAKSNVNVLDFLLKTLNVTQQDKNNFLDQYIDDLIALANHAEKDVRNEIKYNELVISNQGDVQAAKEQYDQWIAYNQSEFDIVAEMIDWIYRPNEEGMNPTIRKMMLKLIKDLNFEAIKRNVGIYRSRLKSTLAIQIGEYQTVANLNNPVEEVNKIGAFFLEKAKQLISEEKTWPCFLWFGGGVLATVGAIALEAPALFVGLAAGAAGGVLKILLTNKRKKNIAKDCELLSNQTTQIFNKVAEEFKGYLNEFREYDKYFEEIEQEFQKM